MGLADGFDGGLILYLVAGAGWLDNSYIGVGLGTWLAGQPKHEAQSFGSFAGHMWGKLLWALQVAWQRQQKTWLAIGWYIYMQYIYI